MSPHLCCDRNRSCRARVRHSLSVESATCAQSGCRYRRIGKTQNRPTNNGNGDQAHKRHAYRSYESSSFAVFNASAIIVDTIALDNALHKLPSNAKYTQRTISTIQFQRYGHIQKYHIWLNIFDFEDEWFKLQSVRSQMKRHWLSNTRSSTSRSPCASMAVF